MKCQDLFSLENTKTNFECRLLQIMLGALRVKAAFQLFCYFYGDNAIAILALNKDGNQDTM